MMSFISKLLGRKTAPKNAQPTYIVEPTPYGTMIHYDPAYGPPVGELAQAAAHADTLLDLTVDLVDDEDDVPTRPYHRITTKRLAPISDEMIEFAKKLGE